MTSAQIIAALDRYIAHYAPRNLTPQRFPASDRMITKAGAVEHALWMCHEAQTFAVEKPAKAMRWLCFVQGVLWSVDEWTIDEFKDDNRSKE